MKLKELLTVLDDKPLLQVDFGDTVVTLVNTHLPDEGKLNLLNTGADLIRAISSLEKTKQDLLLEMV